MHGSVEKGAATRKGRKRNGVIASQSKLTTDRPFLVVNADQQYRVLHGLASPVRLRILRLLLGRGSLNINQIAEALDLPQSTIATNVQVLEDAELVATALSKAAKGQQKICTARHAEIVVKLDPESPSRDKNIIDVEMPLRLYTNCNVSAPCGLCSTERVRCSRRAGVFPQSESGAGVAALVRPRLCRIQVSQQRKGFEGEDRCSGIFNGALFRSSGN
jgi:DNA-binding transcriptional ArsR family regulator